MFEITEVQLEQIIKDYYVTFPDPASKAMRLALEKQGIRVKKELKLKKGHYYRTKFLIDDSFNVIFYVVTNPLKKFDGKMMVIYETGNSGLTDEIPTNSFEEVEDQHWFDKE